MFSVYDYKQCVIWFSTCEQTLMYEVSGAPLIPNFFLQIIIKNVLNMKVKDNITHHQRSLMFIMHI